RVLAQPGAETVRKAQKISAELALRDDGLLALMLEFNRVFQAQDVDIRAVRIDAVDHRGEGGGLAGTGRTGDKHQAARQAREVIKNLRREDVFQLRHLFRDAPQDTAPESLRAKNIHAKTMLLEGEAEIRLAEVARDLNGIVRRERAQEVEDFVRINRRTFGANQFAVHAINGRFADAQMDIRRAALDGEREDIGHLIAVSLGRQTSGAFQRLAHLRIGRSERGGFAEFARRDFNGRNLNWGWFLVRWVHVEFL